METIAQSQIKLQIEGMAQVRKRAANDITIAHSFKNESSLNMTNATTADMNKFPTGLKYGKELGVMHSPKAVKTNYNRYQKSPKMAISARTHHHCTSSISNLPKDNITKGNQKKYI